eukprot:2285983-Pleurochrysis_carterae.AAC.2
MVRAQQGVGADRSVGLESSDQKNLESLWTRESVLEGVVSLKNPAIGRDLFPLTASSRPLLRTLPLVLNMTLIPQARRTAAMPRMAHLRSARARMHG